MILGNNMWKFIGDMKDPENILIVNFNSFARTKETAPGYDIIACGDLTAIANNIVDNVNSGVYPSGVRAEKLCAIVTRPQPKVEGGAPLEIVLMGTLHDWAREHLEATRYTELVANS